MVQCLDYFFLTKGCDLEVLKLADNESRLIGRHAIGQIVGSFFKQWCNVSTISSEHAGVMWSF